MYLCIVYYYILIYIDSLPLTISYLYNEHSLLENTPWEPVGNILRHRFSNRFPQTETNGLNLGHRIFHPDFSGDWREEKKKDIWSL